MASMPEGGIPRKSAWVLLGGGLAAVAGSVALGAIIRASGNGPTALESAWMQAIEENREPFLEATSRTLDFVGGGWVAHVLIPMATILVLLLARRRWGAIYYAGALAMGVLSLQLLKAIFDRPRPEEILVTSDVGSFPSGHVTHAVILVVTLALVVSRAWIWYAGAAYVIVMALSRTYLAAHWITDTVGGVLLGGGIAIALWVPLAGGLATERHRRRSAVHRRMGGCPTGGAASVGP